MEKRVIADPDPLDKGISMKEALGLLKIYESLDIETILKSQVEGIERNLKASGIHNLAPTQTIAFVIPLDSYVPLPEPYHATMVFSEEAEKCTSFSAVTIASYKVEMKLGEQSIPVRLSYAITAVSQNNTSFSTIDSIEKLHEKYSEALRVTNNVVSAYKLTPWRHNHHLQPVTALGSPGNLRVAIFDVMTKRVVAQGDVLLHEHLFVDTWEAREMRDVELRNFAKIHVSMQDGWSMSLWLATKVNEAVDARCQGRDDSAVILADHYAELTMRFLFFGVLRTKGIELRQARAQVRKNTKIDLLVSQLAKELGHAPTQFKQSTGYSTWNQACRKLRNKLNHEIEMTQITPHQSFRALDTTLQMIKKMCEAVNKAYPEALRDTQWLMGMAWITDSMKKSRKSGKQGPVGRGDSPYNPDFAYDQIGMRPSN